MQNLMQNKKRWLQFALWLGIIGDAGCVVAMISPDIFLSTMWRGIDLDPASPGLRMGLLYGTPLMVGWTLVMLWAVHKPLERKFVVLLTAFPVIAGGFPVSFYIIASGLNSLTNMLPQLVTQVVMTGIFGLAYWYNRTSERETTEG